MTPDITLHPVETRADRRAFVALANDLHRHDPNWISPLRMEEEKKLNPKKHPFYQHGEGAFWIARRGGKAVGRIAALVNRLHLNTHRDATGHFGMVAGIDDQAVFDVLFETAAGWLRGRGLARMLGPVSLSINEEIGLLVDGFDTPPMILMGHNPSYYETRFAGAGLSKAKDLNAFLIDLNQPLPVKFTDILERMRARTDATIRHSSKAKLADDLRLAVDIFNDAWAENWGFVPLTEAEAEDFIRSVRHLLDPEGVMFAEWDGEAVAIMAAIPNLNEAIRDLDGRLFPFGWAKLLWRLKIRGLSSARVFFMGVRRSMHRTPVGAALAPIMMVEAYHLGKRVNNTRIEMSWVLEDNQSINGYFAAAGVPVYKTYRVFEKLL